MGITREEAVDCISRADVLKLMKDNWHTHNGDWAMQESMDDIRALPSVTPQPTKNDLAQERYQDLIEYFGSKEVAKTILGSRKEFKAWLERLRWNVKRADELARELEQIKPTTKNDLGVDAVSRKAVINQIFYSTDNNGDVVLGSALRERIKKLPSITPTSRESVDCIDRQATLDAIIKRLGIKNETYLLEAERAIYQQILAMPSVTPQEPFINKPCVSSGVCEHDKNKVLDKIRAEIVEVTKCPYGTECLGANCPSNTDCMICGDHVLEILDKYKAETEE